MFHFLLNTTVLHTVQSKIQKPKIINNSLIYLLFLFLLDPEQIIPDPDPGNSFGSDRIRIRNTARQIALN